MGEDTTTQTLQQSFADHLDSATIAAMRQVAARKTYLPDEVICRQGEREHTFYVIVSGRVGAYQQLDNGDQRQLSIMSEGDYFGEMSLIDDAPRMATCRAITETTVLEITEELFDRLTGENPAMAHLMMRRILARARKSDRIAMADLQRKNEALDHAYAELQAAQARLMEKERIERELELAAQAQRDLLPGNLPQYPDYRFASFLEPARHVGGDFYDVMEIDDEHVGLLIADVADKGFHAALVMALARTLFWEAGRHTLSPLEVAYEVHRGMQEVAPQSDAFVTAFYGVLHRSSGLLRYVRAGQERPLLLRPHLPILQLPGKGRFLGMLNPLTLEENSIQLQPGDRLVLFSDGVTDAINPQNQHYDLERLIRFLQHVPPMAATQLLDHILKDLQQWRQDAPSFDDTTLLVVEVLQE